MSEVLFRKVVDRSLLKEGTTLPRAIQDKYDVKDFSRTPNAIFRRIHKQMKKREGEE